MFELPTPVSLWTRLNHFIGDITMSATDVYEALMALNPTKSVMMGLVHVYEMFVLFPHYTFNFTPGDIQVMNR